MDREIMDPQVLKGQLVSSSLEEGVKKSPNASFGADKLTASPEMEKFVQGPSEITWNCMDDIKTLPPQIRQGSIEFQKVPIRQEPFQGVVSLVRETSGLDSDKLFNVNDSKNLDEDQIPQSNVRTFVKLACPLVSLLLIR